MNGQKKKHRALDFVLYVVIALGLLAVGFAYVTYGPVSWMPSLPWWGLAGETGVLFGYVAKALRPYWRIGRFWVGFLGLLAAHLVVLVVVLLRVEHFGLLWFVFIGYGEWVGLLYVFDILLRNSPRAGQPRIHKPAR